MGIWITTSRPENYAFLELHYSVRFFKSFKEVEKWLLCSDIARPRYALFDLMVDKVSFFSFQAKDHSIEEALRLIDFGVIMPHDDIDLARKCYSMGSNNVLVEPINPGACRSYIEQRIDFSSTVDIPIRNCFQGMGIDFTPTEDQILYVFSKMKDHKVRAETIRKYCWGDQIRQDKNLEVHLTNLRRKIEKLGYAITKNDSDYALHRAGLSPFGDQRPTQFRRSTARELSL